MIVDDINITRSKLDALRARKPKFICINDDMRLAPQAVQETVRNFFRSIAPLPCPAELPQGSFHSLPLYLGPLLARHARLRQIRMWLFVAAAAVCAVIAWVFRRKACSRSHAGCARHGMSVQGID
jgi:hypothetical protein